MNENFNKNAKLEQLTKMFLSREEEKGLTVKDPYDPNPLPYDSARKSLLTIDNLLLTRRMVILMTN